MRVHVHGCDMQCVARGGCCHVRFFLARSCWIVASTEQRAYHNVFLFIASNSHRHNHTYKMRIRIQNDYQSEYACIYEKSHRSRHFRKVIYRVRPLGGFVLRVVRQHHLGSRDHVFN